MSISRHQNAGKNQNMKTADRSFENVAKFKYLITTVTNQCLIQEEIKSSLNSGKTFIFSFTAKNAKLRIYKTIILPVVLYGCETWTLTLREERRQRVPENRVLRRIFGPKRNEMIAGWK
jgi:hypothetical protein